MVRLRRLVCLALGLALGRLPPSAVAAEAPVELTIYAAASLRDVLVELAPAGERATGTRWRFNFAGSNDLARQIEAANKADLFFSADESWMDRVGEAGLVDAPSRRSPLSNRLVVVAPLDSRLTVAAATDLATPSVRRLALAHPEATPAGKYARAWLERSGQWNRVAERVVPFGDVRAVLAAVESGAVEAGVVYRTDALRSNEVRLLYEVPEAAAPPISYALAALAARPRLAEARAVAQWLSGPEAAPIYVRYGFVVR